MELLGLPKDCNPWLPGLPKACQGCAEKRDGRPLATNFSLGRTLGIGGHTLKRMNAQVSLYVQTTGRCLQLAIVFFSCSVRWSTPCQENMVNKKSTIYQTKTVDNNQIILHIFIVGDWWVDIWTIPIPYVQSWINGKVLTGENGSWPPRFFRHEKGLREGDWFDPAH